MAEQRILVAEDGDGRVSIYKRRQVFHYDLRLRGYDKDRGSTGCADETDAHTFALKQYEAAKRQARSGLSPTKGKLSPRQIVERFLEYRLASEKSHSEDTKAAAIMPLFADWMESGGYKTLAAIPSSAFENDDDADPARDFVLWRRRRNADLPDTYTYVRDGKTIEAPRPARHRKEPSAASLNRELVPVRAFLKWAGKHGFLTTNLSVPRLEKTTRIQTCERTRGEAPDLSWLDDAAGADDWLTVDEYVDVLEATQAICLEAVTAQVANRSKYKSQYRNRPQPIYGRPVKTWWTFYSWLMIAVNSGMRPVEWRNLVWRQIRDHRMTGGAAALRIQVLGKGKSRRVVVREGVRTAFDHIARVTLDRPLEDVLADDGLAGKYVFPQQEYTNALKEAVERAGIDKSVTQYTLRHTFINWQLLYTDLKPSDICLIAGNSEAVLKRHYEHISAYELAEGADIERQRGMLELTDEQVADFLAKHRREG